jgi:predicted phosphodiesterase
MWLATLALATGLSSAQPTYVPDRLIATPLENAGRGVALTWRESGPVEIEVEPADDFAPVGSDRARVEISESRVPGAGETYKTAEITNLQPGVEFRVTISKTGGGSYQTLLDLPEADDPLTVLYLGDAQNVSVDPWREVVDQAWAANTDYDLVLHAGDLVDRANSPNEWDKWFSVMSRSSETTLHAAAAGNHEYTGGSLSRYWQAVFEFPDNGVSGLDDTNYVFNYGPARFYVLNTNRDRNEQLTWLKMYEYRNPDSLWTIVMFHHPVRAGAHGRNGWSARDRARAEKIFSMFDVDLVLMGHDHVYYHSQPIRPEGVEGSAPVYVVSFAGTKRYDLRRQPWMAFAVNDTPMAHPIEITGDSLTFSSEPGTPAFMLEKRDGETVFIDRSPR